MNGALAGLLVLDLTQGIAGPFGTKHLADYGARVVKVERPGSGDVARRLPPFYQDDPHPEKSGRFLFLNTNKQGVTLNLKDPTGVALLRRLAQEADLVVESFRPGVMERLGLGYAELSASNPALSMISLSDFGQTGPYRDYRLTELVAFGLAGPMNINGSPDREPLKFAENAALGIAALALANAAVAVAVSGKLTGQGRYVDLSIADSMLATTQNHPMSYFYTGEVSQRTGTAMRAQFLIGSFPCKDGYIAIQGAGRGEEWWQRFFRMLGQPELSKDPRFCTSEAIMEHGDDFDAVWYSWLMDHTRIEIFDAAGEARYPIAPVYTSEDIYNDPHFNERGFLVEIDHPATGPIRYPGLPFRHHGSPPDPPRPAPLLGQHNREVLQGMLGLSSLELGQLAAAGVV